MAPVQVSMAPLAPLLLVLLASSALAPCRAVVVRVPCPSISAVSVSISTANVSSFFDGGGLTFDNADSPEECISLAQQNGCYGDINKFYVYSKEGFSPDSGEKLGNCLYGSSCAATGLPSGSTPAVIGKIENPDCNYTNFLPCPTGLGVRSVGLNLSYSPDGIIFTGSFFQSTANVSSAGECRTFAQSKICSPFGFKKAGSAGAPAISSRRGQEVAQAPSGGGFYPVFWVYLPKDYFISTFGIGGDFFNLGNCLAGDSCGSLPAGNNPALFGNAQGGACPPSPPYPPQPSPPPPLKLGACPAGTGLKTVYLDTFNAYSGFRRGSPFNYTVVGSAEQCAQLARADTCAGNPVDFFMYSITPLSYFGSAANCAWGVCRGLPGGKTPVKVGRLGLGQCVDPSPPPPPPPQACLRAARNKRKCYCPVPNASCQKNPLCGNRWVCTCKSGTPVLDPVTSRLASCSA